MVNQQVREAVEIGAVTIERAVVPAHPAVGAVFPAEVRRFDYGADEDFVAKLSGGQFRRALMEICLRGPGSLESFSSRKLRTVNHAASKGSFAS
jgi:hypothetical protein